MDGGAVAIALPGDPEQAREVLNRGRRIARELGAGWLAVRVVTGESAENVELGELVPAFGGRFVEVHARDVATGLLEVSVLERVRWMVLGCSGRPRVLPRLRAGVTERVLRGRRRFDVIVAAVSEDF